jgi:hypothetical protein
MRADRWLRMLIWLVLANALHILALVAIGKIVGADQALDALLTLAEHSDNLWSAQLLAPAMLGSVVIGFSSALVGFSARNRIAGQVSNAISSRVVALICVVVFPFLIVMGLAWVVGEMTGYIVGASASERAGLLASIAASAVLQALVYRWLIRRKEGPSVVCLAAGMVLLLAVLGGIILGATDVGVALVVGPIGIALVAAAFWSAAVSIVFITIPLLIDWLPASALWFVAIILFSFRMDDPYRIPAGAIAVEPAEQLDARRYHRSVDALYTWLSSRLPANDAGGPIPVILVTADGGGIRAAYWAARSLAVLDRMTDGQFSKHTFAYSGVSGGSLGIATFVDAAARHEGDPAAVLDEIDRFYSRDLLSPVLSRLLLVDPMRFVTNSPGIDGRDRVFEKHLATQWHEVTGSSFLAEPMLDVLGLQAASPPPLVIFNSTIVETGMRLEIANVGEVVPRSRGHSFFAGFREVDVPALTVAESVHVSARFPGLSPPASIAANMCKSRTGDRTAGPCEWVPRHWFTAVDGGYYDNSGLAPIIAMLDYFAAVRDRPPPKQTSSAGKASEAAKGAADIEFEKRKALLSRVSFHVVVLVANPEYVKRAPTEEGKKSDGNRQFVVTFKGDPFQQPRAAEDPMWDIGAAVNAVDNARAGREPESALTMEMLLSRIPEDAQARLRDSMIRHDIMYTVDPHMRTESAEISSACAGIRDEDLPLHLADIPLGWSLSKAAQNNLKCASERTAYRRFKQLESLAWHWARKGQQFELRR